MEIPKKLYVVMEIGWEYDDDYWYRPESKGGNPKVAYLSKQDAQIACAEMNAKALEQPCKQECRVEWQRGSGKYIEAYFEVVAVEVYGE